MSRLKLAMLVVDANDVRGAMQTDFSRPSPICHTAVEALLDGLSRREDLECHVVYGSHRARQIEYRQQGSLTFTAVPYRPWRLPIGGAFLAKYTALLGYLRKLKPDVVHGQGTEREAGMVAIRSGRPSVMTLHGNMEGISRQLRSRPFSYGWIAGKLENYTVRRANAAICLSDYSAELIRPLARKVIVIGNPVDRSFFEVVRKPALQKTLLCIGHISPRKNQNAFINAFRPIAEELHSRVIFAGGIDRDTAYGQEFLRLVEENPWVEFQGLIDRPSCQALLAEAAALILPSIEDNCPMVLLEAIAAGTPVLGSNVGGIPQILESGEIGRLFNPMEAGEMRDACRAALSGGDEIETKAAQARVRLQQKLHPDSVAAMHMGFYREILSSR